MGESCFQCTLYADCKTNVIIFILLLSPSSSFLKNIHLLGFDTVICQSRCFCQNWLHCHTFCSFCHYRDFLTPAVFWTPVCSFSGPPLPPHSNSLKLQAWHQMEGCAHLSSFNANKNEAITYQVLAAPTLKANV